MNRIGAATAESGIEAVREQVRSLARRLGRSRAAASRVRLQRVEKPRPGWRITARIARRPQGPQTLAFTARAVEVGEERIVVPEPDVLTIVSVGLKNDRLTLCLAEAKHVLREGDRAVEEASDLLDVDAQTLKQLTEPARQIAATRALRALSHAIAHSSIPALTEAASARTDVEVLIQALLQPGAIESMKAEDPLGPARVRGLQERERLLQAEGGTLSANEVASHLNITRQAVNKRRVQDTLVALDAGRHGYRYPAWQFVRNGTLPSLDAALTVLRKHDPWMRHIFMVSPNTRLNGRTPLQDLREGRIDVVLRAARAFGEHGAA